MSAAAEGTSTSFAGGAAPGAAARAFLGISGVVWLGYGLYCLVQPGSLGEAAGVVAASPTGRTELRAMYGGLQAALGALALLGALRGALARPALLALLFVTAGLALGRLAGVALDGGLSSYTGMGLGFEIGSAVLAALLLARRPAPAAA